MLAEVVEEIAAAIKLGGFNLAVFLNSSNRQNKSHVKFSRYTVGGSVVLFGKNRALKLAVVAKII